MLLRDARPASTPHPPFRKSTAKRGVTRPPEGLLRIVKGVGSGPDERPGISPARRRPGARVKLGRSTWEESGAVTAVDICDRSRLLELAERLPEDGIQAATRYLEFLTGRGDPYLAYLMSVPEEAEELSEEGHRLLDEGWEDIEAGRLIGSDDVAREFGL